MKRLPIILFLLCFLPDQSMAQDTLSANLKELISVSDHYKNIESLQMKLSFKAFSDTNGRLLIDSQTEQFVSYYGRTFTSILNTVSIQGDSFLFFIDFKNRLAMLDKRPPESHSSIINRLSDFLNQTKKGCHKSVVGDSEVKYHIFADSLVYDWVDIYVYPGSHQLDKIVYCMSHYNTKLNNTSLMVISFQNQEFGQKISDSVFSLDKYFIVTGKREYKLLPQYQNFNFHDYLN